MIYCPVCHYCSTRTHQLNKYTYYHCGRCRMLFLYPKPTQNQIQHYYKNNFQYSAGNINEKIIRIRSRLILNKIQKLISSSASYKLLDIGSGYGYFLDTARLLHPKVQVMGIEPNKSLSNYSTKHLNLKVLQTDFYSFYIRNKNKFRYDVITLIHTIEHVTKPKKLINQAISLLNPGGLLYIETPNFDSHLYRTEQNKFTFLTPPDHIYIFSIHSFKSLLPYDSTILHYSTYSYPEHFMGIVKKIIHTKPDQPLRLEIGFRKDLKINKKHKRNIMSHLKYLIFDKFVARICYPLLNLHYQGSILELYIKKK